jgi:hypothetical protein
VLIGCLGWGSLAWDPRTLPVQREWFTDGPFAPIEFTRQSADGRVTLVIDRNAAPLQLLWAKMTVANISHARESLRDREGITAKQWSSLIGSWQRAILTGGNPQWPDQESPLEEKMVISS